MNLMLSALGNFFNRKANLPTMFANELLPEDAWFEILLRVNDEDLFRIRLVCHIWRSVLESPSFWLQKCHQRRRPLPRDIPSHRLEQLDYRKIYLKRPFGRNLIKNPSGEDTLKHWNIVRNGGDGFAVEQPPRGCDTEGFPICFATSYGSCAKQQLIELEKEGCDPWILDELQPKIHVSEWHAARFDCASTYEFYVTLLRNSPIVNSSGAAGPSRHWRDNDNNGMRQSPDNVVAEFCEPTVVEQWVGRAWQEACHTFINYGPGVRYILLQSSGKDNQYWAGRYGPKMAKAHVSLAFD